MNYPQTSSNRRNNNDSLEYGTASGLEKRHDGPKNSSVTPEDKIENTNAFFQDLQKFIKRGSADNIYVNDSPASIPMDGTAKPKSLNGKISFSEHLLNLKNTANGAKPEQVVDSYANIIIQDAFVPVAVKSSDAPTPVKSISKFVKAKVPSQPGIVSTETLSKQILLVEDDLLLRKSLAFYISDKGFKVVQAENGMEALEHIKNKKFDLIITDLKLPYVGGMEMINIVRNELKITTPIIVLSVSGVEEVEVNSFTIGANEFIAKPFSPSVLMARIDNLIAKKAA